MTTISQPSRHDRLLSDLRFLTGCPELPEDETLEHVADWIRSIREVTDDFDEMLPVASSDN